MRNAKLKKPPFSNLVGKRPHPLQTAVNHSVPTGIVCAFVGGKAEKLCLYRLSTRGGCGCCCCSLGLILWVGSYLYGFWGRIPPSGSIVLHFQTTSPTNTTKKLSSSKGAWSGPSQQLEGWKCLVFGSGGIGGRYDANKAGWGDLPGQAPLYATKFYFTVIQQSMDADFFLFLRGTSQICWAYENFPREIKGNSGWLGVWENVDLMEIQYRDVELTVLSSGQKGYSL